MSLQLNFKPEREARKGIKVVVNGRGWKEARQCK
jgi:hypothetical protein